MRMKNFYIPIIKSDSTTQASIASHKLMLRAGMIRKLSQGIYTILPLGQRVLKKIIKIIEEECDKAGCQQLIMPTIQPASLWEQSGRYDSYGSEMLRIKDRHNKDFLYGPTNEEVITDLLLKDMISYKNFPINLYQIHWKFRDEIRPRFGLMRCREFLMFDSYSFDLSESESFSTYYMYYKIYLRIFKRIGVFALPIAADSGQIGGSMSHEFQIIADTGESEIIYDKDLEEKLKNLDNPSYKDFSNLYAVTSDKHDPKKCLVDAKHLSSGRGIEVGHIFSFGQKYSDKLGLCLQDKDGKNINPFMGSYGIGVSRLMAALIEANHDERGIIWNESVAPFLITMFNFDPDIEEVAKSSDELYNFAISNGVEILYDDTDSSIGNKRNNADLIGIPYQICFGKRNMEEGKCEIKSRKINKKVVVPIDAIKKEIAGSKDFSVFFKD